MQKGYCKKAPGGDSGAIEIPVPQPASGQVLIKVECAPINPSDIYFIQGLTEKEIEESGGKINYPMATGWEGSGRQSIARGPGACSTVVDELDGKDSIAGGFGTRHVPKR